MTAMERSPGRHVTRRLEEPRGLGIARQAPGATAAALAAFHNAAVRAYGSDCGGYHAFDPGEPTSSGVWTGEGAFPAGTVISRLSWGRIDARTAQRLLEADGFTEGE